MRLPPEFKVKDFQLLVILIVSVSVSASEKFNQNFSNQICKCSDLQIIFSTSRKIIINRSEVLFVDIGSIPGVCVAVNKFRSSIPIKNGYVILHDE